MEAAPNRGGTLVQIGFTFFFIALGVTALYYLYVALYGSASTLSMKLLDTKMYANTTTTYTTIPTIYSGGEYSVNMWIYINSFTRRYQQRKPILILKGGESFATLLVALGATDNRLIVRTTYDDTDTSTEKKLILTPSDNNPSIFSSFLDSSITTEGDIKMCDVDDIDLQRWVMVSVVLSGNVVDVYLNGKLARSCTTPSYFRVDPTGTPSLILCPSSSASQAIGFDGYISGVGVSNSALNPEQVYRLYLSGPEGSSWDITKWLKSVFTGSAAAS